MNDMNVSIKTRRKQMGASKVILLLVLAYLFIPVLVTVLFSFATQWHHTLLPEGLTLDTYRSLFTDITVLRALGRSTVLCAGTTLLALGVIVPMEFVVLTFFPRLEKLLQSLLMLTYAVPGIILAIGLIRTYSSTGIPMLIIVVGVYVILLLPIIYQAVKNSLLTIKAPELVHSATLLGSSPLQAFLKVILPCIAPGVLVAALLSFSILFGEFTLINMLVGGKFKTLQMILYETTNKDAHAASALTSAYFLMMGLLTLFLIKRSNATTRKGERG